MSATPVSPSRRSDDLLTGPQVAGWLAVHPSTVRRLADRGHLPRVRVGPAARLVRYRASDVAALIDAAQTSEATGAQSDGFAKPSGGALDGASSA